MSKKLRAAHIFFSLNRKTNLKAAHPQGAYLPPGCGDDPSEGVPDHPPRGPGPDDCRRGIGAQGSHAGQFERSSSVCQLSIKVNVFQIAIMFSQASVLPAMVKVIS